MDLTRPSSGHDQQEDPIKIHHPEEEEPQESRASRMMGKVKARAKKFKNRFTKQGNENEHDVVEEEEEEDDESDETEAEKHVAPVNKISNVGGYGTSEHESLSLPRETNLRAPEEIVPSGTKDSTAVYSSDNTGRVEPEPLRDAIYQDETPSYPVRTSDVPEREDGRETRQVPLNNPVSLLSPTTREEVTNPSEDEFVGGQREVSTDNLSGESTYQSKTPYQGSGEAKEDDRKSGLGTELEYESGGKPGTEVNNDFPVKSHGFDQKIESRDGGKPVTEPSDDFPVKSHDFDQKIQSRDGGKPGTELPAKSEQTVGSVIAGGGETGTERREDFLGKNYEFDQEIESMNDKDSSIRHGGDESFPTKSDDIKVETGTDDHFSPEFSGPKEREDFDSQAEQTRYDAQEPKLTTYTKMVGSSTPSVTNEAIPTMSALASSLDDSGKSETFAEKFTTDDENASPKKFPLSGGGNGAKETEQGEDKGVSTIDQMTPEEEEEDKAFSDMVAQKLNLGGEKKTTTTNEGEVAVEKIPSDKLPEGTEHSEAVDEEGKGGGIVGTIKGVYNYWVGGTTEEGKPKSPNSVQESSPPLGSTVETKGFSDSGESGLAETGNSTGAVPVQKGL